jgi:exocyst complex protein 7
LKATNIGAHKTAIAELSELSRDGSHQLEKVFRDIVREDCRPVEPLHFITKGKRQLQTGPRSSTDVYIEIPFPAIPQEKSSRMALINSFVASSAAQTSQKNTNITSTAQIYADERGPYMNATLQNLAAASISTAKKKDPDAIYRQGTSGIGTYATGLEGLLLAEYDSICPIFSREEWGRVYHITCRSALNEFGRTIRELNSHIKANLMTDCFLAYEIIDIVTNLSYRIDNKTGELKQPFSDLVKPIRETAKTSLSELLDDVRRRILVLQTLPPDGSVHPLTNEIVIRLQTLPLYLAPLSTILISLGDGNWSSSTSQSTSKTSQSSYDVGADGRQLLAHYTLDMIDTLLSNSETKARNLLKGKGLLAVFMANNVAVIDRAIRTSDLYTLLGQNIPRLEIWRKKGNSLYLDSWRDASSLLMDVQYTNRGGGRPSSGPSVNSVDIVRALSSKDKDSIKEKFKGFNGVFDDLVARHKSMNMEREVRSQMARGIQEVIEPLYSRFWDRYHEIDKGKGKYVKYDKGQLATVLAALG